mgnify:CR=1 FL=1
MVVRISWDIIVSLIQYSFNIKMLKVSVHNMALMLDGESEHVAHIFTDKLTKRHILQNQVKNTLEQHI